MADTTRGAAWKARVLAEYELDASGLEVLDLAAQVLDLFERTRRELADLDLYVPGSRPGQFVANGLIGECRQLAETFARLVRGLQLPGLEDDETERARAEARSTQARANALGGRR